MIDLWLAFTEVVIIVRRLIRRCSGPPVAGKGGLALFERLDILEKRVAKLEAKKSKK